MRRVKKGILVRKLLLLFVLFFLIMSGSRVLAGEKVFSARQFTISDGLSSNSIMAVYQDSKGFLWVGTQDGLNRYDGRKFEVFRHIPGDSSSISGNYILSLAEDLKGNIWIGTRKQGVSVYHKASGSFRSYGYQPGREGGLPEKDVLGFYISATGVVWVKTEHFLCRFNPDDETFVSYGHYSNLFKRSMAFSYPVVQESDTSLLVGTKDGINRFLPEKGVFERLFVNGTEKCNTQVSDVVGIGNGLFLAATHSGLRLFDSYNWMVEVPPKNYSVPELAVNTLLLDRKGTVWLGSKKGLEQFNPEAMVHEIMPPAINGTQSVIPYEVISIFEDASGLLWVGTRFNGLFKVSTTPPKFSGIGEENQPQWPLRSYNVHALYCDDTGVVWAGTLTSGLYALNLEQRQIKNITINKDLYSGEDDAVYCICDAEERLWLGTNNGIHIYEKSTGQVGEFSYGYDAKYATLLKNNRIKAIARDSSGGIWFGSQFGLYRYVNNRLVSYFRGDEPTLPSDDVNALMADDQNRLWIGTGEGLCYFDLSKGLIMPVRFAGQPKPFKAQILSLARKNDQLWVGTQQGLFVLDPDPAGGYRLTQVKGLPNEMINGILVDKTQNIWITTGKGISFIAPDGTLQSFDRADGLPGHIFNPGSVYEASSGKLFFGSVSGLCWLHPDSVNYNLNKPQLAITGISVCVKGNCSEMFKEGMAGLKIKYQPGMMVEVDYAALEFTHPEKNHFRVMLEGYDDDWRPVSNENRVTFANITPGEYTLKLIASNNDLTWNNDPLEFPFVVEPPLWMTSYAYAFYLLLIVFIIQLVINYRIRNYKKLNRSLAEKALDKKRIEAQRETLAIINQNLTDSITYATRIQTAMIPTEMRLRDSLPGSFVYFRPRDLVSGDFYYISDQGSKTYLAVVDCTGHGVPGAFMSIIGMDLLKSIIEGHKEEDPAKILSRMSLELDKTLASNSGAREEVITIRDGMDMALCVIDHENHCVEFAGAVNELYLVRNNEIINHKGNRQPLGRFVDHVVPDYTTTSIPILPGDMIYLFTDGYVDQFGGADMKKFKYRRFRHLLLNIHQLAPDDQKAILHQKLEEWKGDLEQVDDILVLGFSPFR